MVLSAHGSRNKLLFVLGFFTELLGLVCMDGQPYLVKRRRLFLSLSEEGRKEVMRRELEIKSHEEALEEPEKGLSRLSLAPWGSLPALGSKVSHLST